MLCQDQLYQVRISYVRLGVNQDVELGTYRTLGTQVRSHRAHPYLTRPRLTSAFPNRPRLTPTFPNRPRLTSAFLNRPQPSHLPSLPPSYLLPLISPCSLYLLSPDWNQTVVLRNRPNIRIFVILSGCIANIKYNYYVQVKDNTVCCNIQ